MKKHPDHKYLLALKQGDQKLLSELYSKHTPQVISWVRSNNGTIDDAKDVFQEAVIALYNKALDPDFVLSHPIGGLIFQICKNKWIDQIRKKNKESEVRTYEEQRYNNESPEAPLIELVEQEELRQTKLNATFNQLSELCQKLLRLISEGIKSPQIAQQLQMSNANTVYRRKNACVERWRNLYHSSAKEAYAK